MSQRLIAMPRSRHTQRRTRDGDVSDTLHSAPLFAQAIRG